MISENFKICSHDSLSLLNISDLIVSFQWIYEPISNRNLNLTLAYFEIDLVLDSDRNQHIKNC